MHLKEFRAFDTFTGLSLHSGVCLSVVHLKEAEHFITLLGTASSQASRVCACDKQPAGVKHAELKTRWHHMQVGMAQPTHLHTTQPSCMAVQMQGAACMQTVAGRTYQS